MNFSVKWETDFKEILLTDASTDALTAQGHVLFLPYDSREICVTEFRKSQKRGLCWGGVGKFTGMFKCPTSFKRQEAKQVISHPSGIYYRLDTG